MRALVFAFIAAVAGAMLWLWFQPACAGGHVVRDAAECSVKGGFDAAFCRMAFARAGALARTAGPSYTTDMECRMQWPRCIARTPQGFGPAPSHWCVVRAANGTLARFEPQYNDRGR